MAVSILTVEEFREQFPEFRSVTEYPDMTVGMWLQLAGAPERFQEARWGDQRSFVSGLFVAHHLAYAGPLGRGGKGGASGPVSSKTVGAASVSYDTSAVVAADAGYYNATPYGRQYWSLIMLYGAGVMQL